MFVDTGLLHSAASESFRAGEHALTGAGHLSRAPSAAGMFGDFAAAKAFGDAVGAVRAHNVRTLHRHEERLSALGDKAHGAAAGFAEMDRANASALRAVRCACDT